MTTGLYQTHQERSYWEKFSDVTFFIWIVCIFFDERSAVGRLSLAIFMGIVVLFIFFKAADIKKEFNYPSAVNLFFLSYFAFYAYNYWRIYINGIILSFNVAAPMLKTIGINGIFLYLVYKYCVMKNNMEQVLRIYVYAELISIATVIVQSGNSIFSGRLGGAVEVNANSIALAAITCLIIILYSNSKKRSILNLLLIAAYVGIIMLTGSRKGLLGMAMGIFMHFGMDKGYKRIINILLVILSLFVVYLLVMNVDFLYDIAGHRLEALFSYFKGERFNEASLASRGNYTHLGWKYIGKRIWTGYGLDCFRMLKGAYGTYSHNNYLELMFGCGLIGTLLYYLGYLYILFGHLKLYFKHKIMDAKPYIILMVIQIFLEYAIVTYFERTGILVVVLSLAAMQLLKSKIDVDKEIEENAKGAKKVDKKSI